MDIDTILEYCCDCYVSLATMTISQKKYGFNYQKNVCYGCADAHLATAKGLCLITNIDSYINNFVRPDAVEAVLVLNGVEV